MVIKNWKTRETDNIWKQDKQGGQSKAINKTQHKTFKKDE